MGKVLSAAVLLLIILPLLLSLLLDIPAVQNFVVHKAARMISRKLETTVSIDRVEIGLFSKIKVYGLYVEDYQRDTLLYAGRAEAFVTSWRTAGGGLTLSRAEIAGGKLYLRETPSGEMNIKQVVNRLSKKKKKKKNFVLTIRSARLDGLDLCIDRRQERARPYGIDFSHMHLYGLKALVDDFTIDGTTIHMTVAALTARERSGFVLDNLAGRFYLVNGGLGFQDAHIETARSDIRIPSISLVGDSWADYKDFIRQVRIDGDIGRSTISTDDIAYFTPSLRDWHLTFRDAEFRAEGTVADFAGRCDNLRVGDRTVLEADFAIRGLPDIAATHFDLTVAQLASSAADIDVLARAIARKRLPSGLLTVLDRAGTMRLSGRYKGLLKSFETRAQLHSEAGDATCTLRLQPQNRESSHLQGEVRTTAFELGKLLGRSPLLGRTTFAVQLDGTMGRGTTDANVAGRISQLEFNGYDYDSLRFDGKIRNKEFDGRITARDRNLDFDFFGSVDLNDTTPFYDFQMELRRADLARLHVNRRDSVSILSGKIKAKASGRSLDDLNGRIQISDARYRYNDRQIEARGMTVTGENSPTSKFVELRSDFADVRFRSKTSYREVFEYLKQSAWKYLPLLPDRRDRAERSAAEQTSPADEYSLISVNIKNINPIADAVAEGLQIADGSSLQLMFNPVGDKLSMQVSSEYIERKRMLITRLSVNAVNHGDSLAVYASAEDLYAGMFHLPRLSVTGGAREGQLQLSAGFTDTLRKSSGLLGIRASTVSDAGPAGRTIDLHILPSHITRGDMTWQIFAGRIRIDTTQIAIGNFHVMNREQRLSIDGIASRNREDSLPLHLRNFDLASFSQVANRIGYDIQGYTNGTATIKSALRASEISADILMDSVRINRIPVPPLRLESRWDFSRNRAGVTLTDRTTETTLIRGFYAPEQVRYYAAIRIDSLDMGLIDPVLSGVVSDTKGRADVRLTLQGEHRNAELTGSIDVTGLSTTVDFTGVTYSMPRAVLEVRDNRFRAKNVPIFDPLGNRGRFDFDLSLQHLSNIAYDVRVAPQQMLVLDTTEQDNELFYGRVFATGLASITGDKGGVKLDITASTDDDSSFILPLSGKSNISNADFVTFVQPSDTDTTSYLARKKLMFERRRQRKSASGGGMQIAMALDIRPNLDFQLVIDPASGSAIKGRGEGSLNLDINPRTNEFEMYGDYTIAEGSYLFSLQNLINKKFIIESGSTIQWTGDPVNALLNINAVYKLKASLQPLLQGTADNAGGDRSVPVECVIHLGDRLASPSVSFDVRVPGADPETQTVVANALSTPETVDTQFLYLLVFNSFLSETNSAANSNIGASVSAGAGLEFISNQLSNWLSSDDYNVVIRYRPKSELTSDEVDFGLSKSLINNRLFVEVEGNYVIDNKQAVNSNMSNFMGEAYITYLIDRAGTLKMKVFTQTIDRFDENQGLQETGIGIYFKEDFENFKDLRRRIKERFSNKKRKARKAERAAAREASAAAERTAAERTAAERTAAERTAAEP